MHIVSPKQRFNWFKKRGGAPINTHENSPNLEAIMNEFGVPRNPNELMKSWDRKFAFVDSVHPPTDEEKASLFELGVVAISTAEYSDHQRMSLFDRMYRDIRDRSGVGEDRREELFALLNIPRYRTHYEIVRR